MEFNSLSCDLSALYSACYVWTCTHGCCHIMPSVWVGKAFSCLHPLHSRSSIPKGSSKYNGSKAWMSWFWSELHIFMFWWVFDVSPAILCSEVSCNQQCSTYTCFICMVLRTFLMFRCFPATLAVIITWAWLGGQNWAAGNLGHLRWIWILWVLWHTFSGAFD